MSWGVPAGSTASAQGMCVARAREQCELRKNPGLPSRNDVKRRLRWSQSDYPMGAAKGTLCDQARACASNPATATKETANERSRCQSIADRSPPHTERPETEGRAGYFGRPEHP